MDKQELKLQKIKKSCNIASKVVTVFFTIMIVAFVLLTSSTVLAMFNLKAVNEMVLEAEEAGTIESSVSIQSLKFESDVPAVQEFIENSDYVYALGVIFYMIIGNIYIIASAIILGMIRHIFKILKESESPFDEKILRTLGLVLAFTAIIIGLSIGIGFGVVVGLVFWCIYNFFSYGCELQKLSDETL